MPTAEVCRAAENEAIKTGLPAWEFDVFYTTHDHLMHGITELARSRVEVLAESFLDAQRLAIWMVICRSGFYVTRAEFVM